MAKDKLTEGRGKFDEPGKFPDPKPLKPKSGRRKKGSSLSSKYSTSSSKKQPKEGKTESPSEVADEVSITMQQLRGFAHNITNEERADVINKLIDGKLQTYNEEILEKGVSVDKETGEVSEKLLRQAAERRLVKELKAVSSEKITALMNIIAYESDDDKVREAYAELIDLLYGREPTISELAYFEGETLWEDYT